MVIPVLCVRSWHCREASLLVKHALRTNVLLLIRWFRVRSPGAPPRLAGKTQAIVRALVFRPVHGRPKGAHQFPAAFARGTIAATAADTSAFSSGSTDA